MCWNITDTLWYKRVLFTALKALGFLSGYKVVNAACFGKTIVPSYYRTHSHAGFPKGSYTIPNPTHFHIARQTQIAKMKPLLVSIPPRTTPSNYAYNRGCTAKSTITLNLGNCCPVAINIPADVITGFIYPFAAALNFHDVPQLNNQGSQTTYMNNFVRKPPTTADLQRVKYTPLYIDSYQTCHFSSEVTRHSQSFERQVLNDMQQNLLGDFSQSFSESESESTDAINIPNEPLEEIKQFTEYDELKSNESLTELPQDLIAMLTSSSTNSSEEEEAADLDLANIKDVAIVAENFVNKLMDMSVNSANYFLFESVINEAKNILHQEPIEELGQPQNTGSLDEGIEDCTLTNDSDNTILKCTSPVDDRIKKIGYIVFDYLVQQCFEVKELILFPEVLHDLNINKLLIKLKEVYEECYGNSLNDEEKNELRISIASYVLKLLEIDDRLKDTSQDSNFSIVTDKIFTISEFLSDVLDHFFNSLGNATVNPFLDFEKQITKDDGGVFHSTPESKKTNKNRNSDEEKGTENAEVTSFKKTAKSGSEIYWITLYDSPSRAKEPEIHSKKTAVNVDDIPLRPPDDHLEMNYVKRILSPILEEPRINLFDSELSNKDFETCMDPLYQKYDVLEKSTDSTEIIDEVLSDETDTYVAFDTTDANLVIDNEVDFCRVRTLTTNSYIQVKEAKFKHKCSNSDNKENETPVVDSEGNWMGFEGAMF